jgi:hypothetical protein
MIASRELPTNYHHHKTLDLSRPRIVLWLNLAGFILLILFGWIFGQVIYFFRGADFLLGGITGIITAFAGWSVLALLISLILMLVFHELIHGTFFWLFTHDRPRFALRSGYAYAAAPGWYLHGTQYILVGLSPLVIISIVCLLLSLFVNPSMLPYLLLIATFNAAGAFGDMIVVGWVLKQGKHTLIMDEGDIFYAYFPDID